MTDQVNVYWLDRDTYHLVSLDAFDSRNTGLGDELCSARQPKRLLGGIQSSLLGPDLPSAGRRNIRSWKTLRTRMTKEGCETCSESRCIGMTTCVP